MQIMTPPSHILGLLNIATAFDAGAWIRLHPRFDVDTMLRHIQSDRITIEMAVAPIALALAAHPGLESYDLSSLRYVMWCATPVTQSVAEAVTRRVGVRWVTAYGASELPVISCNPIDGARLDTVGRPVPGVEVRIVSLETVHHLAPARTARSRSGRTRRWPATCPTTPPPTRSATGGTAPATSAISTPTAGSASPTAPRR